ncbi:hypothetical protein GCM10010344_02000 [Streptomyces bluensis]|nr:hypothetical protein GCM10010344_02000 [Streptomyces bluensis]
MVFLVEVGGLPHRAGGEVFGSGSHRRGRGRELADGCGNGPGPWPAPLTADVSRYRTDLTLNLMINPPTRARTAPLR